MTGSARDSIDLLAQAKDGSADGLRQLVDKLDPYIRMVVRRRLPRLLRRRFDSVDFVQAVWTSFLTEEGLLEHFEKTEDLQRYLGGVANKKVLMAIRGHVQTAARDMRLDVSINETKNGQFESFTIDVAAKGPGPASEALAEDLRENALENLPAELREILEMREAGFTAREIAEKQNLSTRSVERALKKLRGAFS